MVLRGTETVIVCFNAVDDDLQYADPRFAAEHLDLMLYLSGCEMGDGRSQVTGTKDVQQCQSGAIDGGHPPDPCNCATEKAPDLKP